ncbi:unnamed protein product, partial [Brassica oleracea]
VLFFSFLRALWEIFLHMFTRNVNSTREQNFEFYLVCDVFIFCYTKYFIPGF